MLFICKKPDMMPSSRSPFSNVEKEAIKNWEQLNGVTYVNARKLCGITRNVSLQALDQAWRQVLSAERKREERERKEREVVEEKELAEAIAASRELYDMEMEKKKKNELMLQLALATSQKTHEEKHRPTVRWETTETEGKHESPKGCGHKSYNKMFVKDNMNLIRENKRLQLELEQAKQRAKHAEELVETLQKAMDCLMSSRGE